MKTGFSVTYERWTPADVEAGDTDDRGFVLEGASLTDAVREGLDARYPHWLNKPEPDGYPYGSGTRWLTFHDWNNGTREHIEQGVTEQRALHIPDSVTDASRLRILRLFGIGREGTIWTRTRR